MRPETSAERAAVNVLVVGATGYIGSRLIPYLIERGHTVRCAARNTERSRAELPPGTHLIELDVLDAAALLDATRGIDVIFYLVQASENEGFDFEARDRDGARNVAYVAQQNGVRRIVVLSGLGDDTAALTAHLRSRHEMVEILRSGRTPVTEFRTALIVGPESIPFMTLRQMVERLPVMVMPRWVSVRTQPIAVDDVVRYLAMAADDTTGADATYEIGGPEIMTYRVMMQRYARSRGLRRLMLQLPVATPRLSSWWVDLITDVPASLARPLIDGLREEAIVSDGEAARRFGPPDVGFDDALRRARDASPDGKVHPLGWLVRIPRHLAGVVARHVWPDVLTDERVRTIDAEPSDVWSVAIEMGGRRGYPILDVLWRVRGAIDRLLGGPGLNRGGPSAEEVNVGDQLDFWRITELEPGRRLRMRALMKVPGEAELEIVVRDGSHSTVFVQTARFRPAGLLGRLYWITLYPVHWIIFRGMADRAASVAQMSLAPRDESVR